MDFLPCLLFFALSTLITPITSATKDIYDGVADGGQSGNPGIKLRITQKGLDYLNSILLYEMNEIIPRLHLDDLEHSESGGHIRITNARITKYTAPKSQTLRLAPPDRVVWSSNGLTVGMSGHVVGSYGRFGDEGDADVTASNVKFTIAIQPLRQSNGQFGARTRSCDADVGGLDFNIYNTGMLGKMLQNNKGAIIKRLRPRIGQELCKQATRLIDNAANAQLSSLPTKVPLNRSAEQMFNMGQSGQQSNSVSGGNTHSRSSSKSKPSDKDNFFDMPADGSTGNSKGDKSKEAQRELTKNITKHLTFDYGNTKDPSVQSRYLETYNKGEISYHGQGGTPFGPPPMHESSIQTDRMVYGLASDYVANSLLYNAYAHDLLKSRISAEETPEFKQYLKTTCDDDSVFDFCLGSIIPEMQDSFPNSQAEINLEATKAPALLFRKDGTINLLGQGFVKLIAVKSAERRTMAVANFDMIAKAKLFLQDEKVKGNCSFDKYDVKITENNLKGFDQKRQQEFINTSKQMMEVMVNAYLRNGLRLPSLRIAKLQNAKLNIFDRTARLDSDVLCNREELTKMAVRVIKQHGGRVEGY